MKRYIHVFNAHSGECLYRRCFINVENALQGVIEIHNSESRDILFTMTDEPEIIRNLFKHEAVVKC